jgi:Flp pilus assembly pilin Flp
MAYALAKIHTWLTTGRADDDRGSSLVEYALLLVLITMVVVVAMGVLGESVSSRFDSTGQALSQANG